MDREKSTFKDVISEESFRKAEDAIRGHWSFSDHFSTFQRETDDNLLKFSGRMKEFEKYINSEIVGSSEVADIKISMDRIAFSLDSFIQDFKLTYEKVLNRNTMDKLMDDSRKEECDDLIGYPITSSPFFANNSTMGAISRTNKSKRIINRKKKLRKRGI